MLHVVPTPALARVQSGNPWDLAFSKWDECDPATLEPRCWYYGRHYLAGAVSATIADGGVGKSILGLTEAIAMAIDRPLLGITPVKPPDYESSYRLQVLYYNAEEPLAEIQRRVLAICQHFDINPALLGPNPKQFWGTPLTVLSGHDFPLVIASADRDGVTFTDHIKRLKDFDGDVIILDPLVSIHQCPENDNSAIDAIVKRLARVAARPPIKSVELVHHARKPAQGGTAEVSGADARGASAIFDGVRSLRTLNRMSPAEALRAKVNDHRHFVRLDVGKSNYAAPSPGSQWYRHKSVILPNNDDVGVIVPWHMPGAFDGVTTAHMHQVRELARGGQYRADSRSPEWIGNAVADVLDLDAEGEADRKRIKSILRTWYEAKVLAKVERRGENRKMFMFVEPGSWAET
jgi:hypothetical protein